MVRLLNIIMFLIIASFLLIVFKYYSSNKNINIKDYNRSNIDQILKGKISHLPILTNDTNNVIEFNDSFDEEIKKDKKRNFWNLLKINEN